MALLLRYGQFCDILEAHPFKATVVEVEGWYGIVDDKNPFTDEDRFTSSAIHDNPFICRINQVLERVEANTVFPSWLKEAREAFVSRNTPALPVGTFELYGCAKVGEKILFDPRCFADHFNAVASVVQANHVELQKQKHMLNDIQNAITNESKITSSFIVGKIFGMERMLQRLVSNLVGELPLQTTHPPRTGIIRFSVSIKCLGRSASLSEITTAFFADDYPNGYKLDTKDQDLDKDEKRKLSKKFSTIKRCVRMVLAYSASYPLMTDDPTLYKESVRRIAEREQRNA